MLGEKTVRGFVSGGLDEDEIADDARSFVDDAAERVDEDVPMTHSMAYGFSTKSKTTHPGSVILDTADEVDADFLVVPREQLTGEPGEVLSKAAEYVLLYASQPVLSV